MRFQCAVLLRGDGTELYAEKKKVFARYPLELLSCSHPLRAFGGLPFLTEAMGAVWKEG